MKKRWNLKNKKGFLGVFLTLFHTFFLCVPLRSAEAPVQSKAPEIIEMTGIRMIYIGTRYMVEVPKLASEWVLRNKDEIVKKNGEVFKQGEEIDKIAKSVSEGMRTVGEMLIRLGVAKEYKDSFDYKNNPKNTLNTHSDERVRIRQAGRLELVLKALEYLNTELANQKIERDWLVKVNNIFKELNHTHLNTSDGIPIPSLSKEKLDLSMGQVGDVLEHLHVYGIGIQVSSDIPLGAFLATAFSRWLPNAVENIGGRIGMEESIGILYYMKLKEKDDKNSKAADYLPNHPLAEKLKNENYGHAAVTYEQGGAQIDGVGYARGNKKISVDINVSVKLTFLASTDVLREFDIANLNDAQVSELSVRNNLTNTLSGPAKTVALKAQEKIQDSFDKSKSLAFLSKDIQIAAAHVWGRVDENTGKVVEIPNMMLRLSMGNYKLTPVAERASNDMFSLSGSLGSLSIDAIEK